MAKGGGDFIENIITLLFIVFFIFSGFFNKKKQKPQQKPAKKPYQPLFPPITQDENEDKRARGAMHGEQRRLAPRERPAPAHRKPPATLKGIFAEVLDQLEEKVEGEFDKTAPKRAPREGEEIPRVWAGKTMPAARTKPVRKQKVIAFPAAEQQKIKEKEISATKAARRERKREAERQKAVQPARRLDTLFTRRGLKNAVIMSELIGKPISLRDV